MSEARRLRIVAVGSAGVALEVASALADCLGERTALRVVVDKVSFRRDPASGPALDSAAPPAGSEGEVARRPSSSALVDELIDAYPEEDGEWILGLTALDLAARGRSHVFGEATLDGRWAVVSTARLGAPGPPSPRLLERLCREAVHEIGHLAGLAHCGSGGACVMGTAATVADVDARAAGFCDACAAAFTRRRVSGKGG